MRLHRLRVAILATVLLASPARAGLPLTPSTTYVANTTPVVKAQDLNDLQKYLAGLFSAIYSVKALVIDGTGGTGVTPVAGTVKVSATVSGFSNAAPFNTASVPWGQIAKEQALLGAAQCSIVAGVLQQCGGFNIKSVVAMGAGLYEVQFNTAGPNALRHTAVVTPFNTSATMAVVGVSTITAGAYKVQFTFYDAAGSTVEPNGFMVQATGG